jgi:hypothetical protein
MNDANKLMLLSGLLMLILMPGLTGCSSKPYDIRFDNPVYNFGTVDEGKDVTHTYVFWNAGREKLVIENVQPTCGCTIANDWDREVQPGKKGKISIIFRTTHYKGEVTKIINVTTNVPEQNSIPLTLKGTVHVPIEISPLDTWLGEIEQSTTILNGSFEITNNMGGTLKILEVIPPDARLKYSLTTITENQKYKLDYTLEAPFEGKDRVEKIFTVKTDSKAYPYLYPKFYYYVPPPLRVFPDRIFIDTSVLPAGITTYDINIKSVMLVPIKVRDYKLYGGKGMTVELKENIKDKYYLLTLNVPQEFRFKPDEKIYLRFWVENDPQKTTYSIPIEELKRQS